jgi:hypothetical protein
MHRWEGADASAREGADASQVRYSYPVSCISMPRTCAFLSRTLLDSL